MVATETTRPALPTLQRDQRALLDPGPADNVEHGLRDGFPRRRRAINWYQRAIVRTTGHIADEWPPADLVRDKTLLSALVVGDERERLVDEPFDRQAALQYRRRLERVVVLPAFRAAYNDMRAAAGEYPEHSREGNHDPEGQEFVAMRPAFQVADEQQSTALRRLWGGFDTRDDLQSWLHDLNEPTNGSLEDDLPAQVGRDRTALRHLLGRVDVEQARNYRERFAVVVLLPAFADGIRRMEAGELATHTSDGLTPAQG